MSNNNIGKELREKNLAKFENSDSQAMMPMLDVGSEITSGTQVQAAGKEFSQDGLFKSPFKNDHFNSKLWGVDLGPVMESQYEENGYNNVLNPNIDFERLRSDNQSAFTKLGGLATQFIGKTGVGVVGNIIGGIYGLGEWMGEDGTVHSLYDNKVTRALDDINAEIEAKNTVFVNQKAGIGLNANTAKGLSDAFGFIASALVSEGIMQTAGNALGGAGLAGTPGRLVRYTKQIGKIMKMLDKAEDTEEYLMKMKGLAKTVDQMSEIKNMSDLIQSATRSTFNTARRALTTTGYEAGLEARGTKDEMIRKLTDEMEYYIERSNMTAEEEEAYRKKKMAEIQAAGDSAGIATFALNTGVLAISNAIQFPQIFGNSFVKNAAIGGLVRKGLGEIGEREGKKAIARKYAGMLGRVLKNPATEFMEETGQGLISNSALNYYEIMMGDRSHAGILAPRVNNIAESVLKGIQQTYGTEQGLHEGIIGAIVGAVGIPGLKKHGKGITWHGGVPGGIREEQERIKANQEAVTSLNSMPISDVVNYNKDNAIRAAVDAQKEDLANLENNKVEFESLRDNKIFRYTIDRLEKGMGDFISQDVSEMEMMSLEDYKKNFGKDESYTEEDKAKDVQNFREKVAIYRNAYNGVHRHFNLNLMRGNKVTKKFTDTLTYAVATEQAYSKRMNDLKSKVKEAAPNEFTDEEIDELFDSSGKFEPFRKEIDQYIAGKLDEKEFGNNRSLQKEREKELSNLYVTGDGTKLSASDFEGKTALEASTEFTIGHNRAQQIIDTIAEINAKYDAQSTQPTFQENKSSVVRSKKKNLKKLVDELNKKANDKLSRSMKEISKPAEQMTVSKLEKYLESKERLAAVLSRAYDAKNVYEKTQEVATAEELLDEIAEITDRFVTATNVAGYLYGFKNDPSKAFNKIVRAQFFADYDNAQRLATMMDGEMQNADPDDEFKARFEEFVDILENLNEEVDEVLATLPPPMAALLKQEFEKLKEKEEKYRKFLKLEKKREEVENNAVESDKKKKGKKPDVTSPTDTKKDPKDAVAEMLKRKGMAKDGTEDEENDEEEEEEDGNNPPGEKGDGEKGEKKGTEGSGNKKAPHAKKRAERDIKKNSLTIRENSSISGHTNFKELLNAGEFKDKAAVTLDMDGENNFDPDKNDGLQYALDRDDIAIPRKFESSKKAAQENGGFYKAIGVSAIDLNKSGIDFTLEEIEAIDQITVLEQQGLNADGYPVGTVRIKTKDSIENFEVIFKKPNYEGSLKDSYNRGYEKIKKHNALSKEEQAEQKKKGNPHPLDVKDISDMDPDVYNFIRYIPIKLNAYDKVLDPADEYKYEIEPDDKPMYTQYLFAADDILSMAEMEERAWAAFVEERDALKAEETVKLNESKHNDDHKTKIKAKYQHAIERAEAKHLAYFNNPHSNFDFRFSLAKQWAFKNNRQLKLKIQHVDQGDFEKFAYEDEKDVTEQSLTTLGYKPEDMKMEDFYYSDQYGNYKRSDGTAVENLDHHPFAYMNKTGTYGVFYLKHKTQTGKEVPIKLNSTRFDMKHINIIMKVTEDYLSQSNRKGFTVKNSGISFLDGRTYEDFMQFFLRKESGRSRHMLYVKNTFNLIEKSDGSSEILFSLGESGAISLKSLNDLNGAEGKEGKKKKIVELLADNRFTISRDYFLKGKKGEEKVNETVMKYYFENKIINHPFNKNGDNFDQIFSPGYNKGIRISRADTPDSIPLYEKPESYISLLKKLKKNLGDGKKSVYETNMHGFLNNVIHKIVDSVSKQQKAITDLDPKKTKESFTDKEVDEFIDNAIERVIDAKLAEVQKVIDEKPYMLKNKDHKTEFKKQEGDSELDLFLRNIYATKKRTQSKAFRNKIKTEYKGWGNATKLVKAFQSPGAGQSFPIAEFPKGDPDARNLNEPVSHIATQEQFFAMRTMANVLKEMVDAGDDVDINFREDFVKNPKKKPLPYNYLKDSRKVKPSDKSAVKNHFKTRLKSVEFKDGGPMWKDGKIVGGKIVFNMQTLGYKTDKNGEFILDKEGKKIRAVKPEQLIFMAPMEDFPKQNFITNISLPFINPATYEMDLDTIDAEMQEIMKRKDARRLNREESMNEILKLLGEDPFKYNSDGLKPGEATDEEIEALILKNKKLKATDPSVNGNGGGQSQPPKVDIEEFRKEALVMRFKGVAHAAETFETVERIGNKEKLIKRLTEMGITDSDTLVLVYNDLFDNKLIEGIRIETKLKKFNTFAEQLLGPLKNCATKA